MNVSDFKGIYFKTGKHILAGEWGVDLWESAEMQLIRLWQIFWKFQKIWY